MQVTFKNTGMIESADIRFDGLTVIAGENDTGKSTIGKLMFSIIKTFNRYERDAKRYRARNIQRLIEGHHFEFRKRYNDPTALDVGQKFFDELQNAALELLGGTETDETIGRLIGGKIDSFNNTFRRFSGMDADGEILPGPIVKLITSKPPKEDIFEWSFLNYMLSVLNGEIANKFAENREYFIHGKEGVKSLFDISGNNGSVELKLKNKIYFEDATFIESPVILNLADTIRFSKTEFDMEGNTKNRVGLLEKAYAPEYMRDLLLKLTERTAAKNISKIEAATRDIIKGTFYYDHEQNEFVFEKENRTFRGTSIASGIKYLGSIGILSQVGFVDKKSLLILDEPENHAHPHWQVKLAEILVKAVEEGCNILLTSHSPYFIEALKVHSDYSDIKKKTAFYVSKKSKTGFTSNIIDVTDDVSPIFELLAEPYDILETIQAEHIT